MDLPCEFHKLKIAGSTPAPDSNNSRVDLNERGALYGSKP